MRKIFALLLIASALIAGCKNYGDRLKVNDKNEIYYKDGASKDDARKLADYFLKNGVFDSKTPQSVQLTKSTDTFNIKLVVDKKKAQEKLMNMESNFAALGMLISMQVFNGKPVRIMFADEYMKTFKEFKAVSMSMPADSATGNSSDKDSSQVAR
jgi:hypothetical protein